MATFELLNRSVELPAKPAPTAETRDKTAWLHGRYLTVQLSEPTVALRVHTDGKAYPGREASRSEGAWLLIGDIILTASQLADSRALPTDNPRAATAFTRVNEAVLRKGSVLNIGIANAKFGGQGGGFQAEYVEGPPIIFKPLSGKYWHAQAGSA